MNNFSVCFWMDGEAANAFAFYQTVFKNVKRLSSLNYSEANSGHGGLPAGSLMTLEFELEGLQILLLNGGPIFKTNPSISLHVTCETVAECDELFSKLADGGEVLMPLDKYPFSEKFGWVNDKFGVSWRVIVGKASQKVTPTLMFQGGPDGTAEAAMKHYTSIFNNSKILAAHKFEEGEGPVNLVKYAEFELNGELFMAFDSPISHAFNFTEGVSLIAYCKTQEEVDHFWSKLTEGGRPSQCGWLVDKIGVSWQITPTVILELMQSQDARGYDNVMKALLEMTKLDIKALEKAAYAHK